MLTTYCNGRTFDSKSLRRLVPLWQCKLCRFRARFCEPLQAREHACAERGWAWNLLELLQCHLRDKKIGESLALSA